MGWVVGELCWLRSDIRVWLVVVLFCFRNGGGLVFVGEVWLDRWFVVDLGGGGLYEGGIGEVWVGLLVEGCIVL